MKTEEELRARVRELVKTDLKRRLDEAHVKLPHLCVHNYRHVLDARKNVMGEPNGNYNRVGDPKHLPLAQTMGLCMLGSEDPEQWKGDICDDPIDAERCPYFKPNRDDPAIVAEFTTHLKEPAWVEENMPAVAALLWAAGGGDANGAPLPAAEPSEPQEAPDEEPPPAPLAVIKSPKSFWQRVRTWFGR